MQIVWRGPRRRLGGLPRGFGGVGHLSLALGRLQLKRWVGVASSTVLRHPEGTAELLPQFGRERQGLELAQFVVLFTAAVYQHKDCQHKYGREHSSYHRTNTVGGHGSTVDAAPLAGRVAEGRGPALEAVAVLVVVADPMAIALLPTAFCFEERGVPALPLEANVVVATLGPGHHQAWVQHVTLFLGTTVDMGTSASDLPSIQDDGGVNGHCVGFQGPGLRTLTLDLPTLGISHVAFLVFPIHVFPTVSKGIPGHIHLLKAEIRSRPGSRTPELLALFLVGEAHAIVAVGLATLTGGAVHLVEVGGAMGRLARAEFWEVTLPCLLTAQGPRGQQLTLVTAGSMGTFRPFSQGAVGGIAARVITFLFLPTVTFFPIFQVTVSTPPASIQRPGVWHVGETHPTA